MENAQVVEISSKCPFASTGFLATITSDITHTDLRGSEHLCPEGARVVIVLLPKHFSTDAEGNMEHTAAGTYLALHGEAWIYIESWQFSVDT